MEELGDNNPNPLALTNDEGEEVVVEPPFRCVVEECPQPFGQRRDAVIHSSSATCCFVETSTSASYRCVFCSCNFKTRDKLSILHHVYCDKNHDANESLIPRRSGDLVSFSSLSSCWFGASSSSPTIDLENTGSVPVGRGRIGVRNPVLPYCALNYGGQRGQGENASRNGRGSLPPRTLADSLAAFAEGEKGLAPPPVDIASVKEEQDSVGSWDLTMDDDQKSMFERLRDGEITLNDLLDDSGCLVEENKENVDPMDMDSDSSVLLKNMLDSAPEPEEWKRMNEFEVRSSWNIVPRPGSFPAKVISKQRSPKSHLNTGSASSYQTRDQDPLRLPFRAVEQKSPEIMVVQEPKEEEEDPKGPYFSYEWIVDRGIKRKGKLVATEEDPKPYRCPVPGCDKTYKNVNGLKYHARYAHTPPKQFLCPLCPKIYTTRHGLLTHIKSHHNPNPKPNSFKKILTQPSERILVPVARQHQHVLMNPNSMHQAEAGEDMKLFSIEELCIQDCSYPPVSSSQARVNGPCVPSSNSSGLDGQIVTWQRAAKRPSEYPVDEAMSWQSAPKRASVVSGPIPRLQVISQPIKIEIEVPTDSFQTPQCPKGLTEEQVDQEILRGYRTPTKRKSEVPEDILELVRVRREGDPESPVNSPTMSELHFDHLRQRRGDESSSSLAKPKTPRKQKLVVRNLNKVWGWQGDGGNNSNQHQNNLNHNSAVQDVQEASTNANTTAPSLTIPQLPSVVYFTLHNL